MVTAAHSTDHFFLQQQPPYLSVLSTTAHWMSLLCSHTAPSRVPMEHGGYHGSPPGRPRTPPSSKDMARPCVAAQKRHPVKLVGFKGATVQVT